jgi:hypothetical protein
LREVLEEFYNLYFPEKLNQDNIFESIPHSTKKEHSVKKNYLKRKGTK